MSAALPISPAPGIGSKGATWLTIGATFLATLLIPFHRLPKNSSASSASSASATASSSSSITSAASNSTPSPASAISNGSNGSNGSTGSAPSGSARSSSSSASSKWAGPSGSARSSNNSSSSGWLIVLSYVDARTPRAGSALEDDNFHRSAQDHPAWFTSRPHPHMLGCSGGRIAGTWAQPSPQPRQYL